MKSSEVLPERRPAALPVPISSVKRLPIPAEGGVATPPDERIDLREMLLVVRRHKWLILLLAVLVAGLTAWQEMRRPDFFQSKATLRVSDERQSLTGGLDDDPAHPFGTGRDPVLSQMEVLASRTLLGIVVDQQGLRARVDGVPRAAFTRLAVTPAAPPETLAVRFGGRGVTLSAGGHTATAPYGQPVELAGVTLAAAAAPSAVEAGSIVVVGRDRAIDELTAGLSAHPREGTGLFDLSYTSSSAAQSQRVLEALIEVFQANNADQAQQESRRRRIFIEGQLHETDSILRVAQAGLTEFRRRQGVYSTHDQFSAEQSGLMELEVRREELAAERQTAAALVAAAERRGADARAIGALISSPAIASNPVITQLYSQLVAYESARDSLTTGQWRSAGSNPDVQRLTVLIDATRGRIAEAVRSQLASLDARLGAVDGLRARRQGTIQTLPGMEAEEVRLSQQVASTQSVADQLRTELQKARISEAVEAGQIEVVDRASLPAVPVPAHRALRVGLGLLVGLAIGFGAAFLRENMNTTVRRREDLEAVVPVASLAVIPQISLEGTGRGRRLGRGKGDGDEGRLLVTAGTLRSSGAEAYRTLRTNLMFSQARQRLKTIVITSAGPSEGKSTTCANLAATFAQQGMRVVLVDCDLRRPRAHEIFALEHEPGLTQVVLGYAPLDEAMRETPIANLWVLPSGTLPPNPSELLGSDRMGEVLDGLRAAFDVVILDTPPVLLAPDASVLASGADGVLLVVRAGHTERNAARQAAQQLATVGGNLVGTVLNDPDAKVPGYSGYHAYNGYGYYGDPAKA